MMSVTTMQCVVT